jgi:hypothetical protein
MQETRKRIARCFPAFLVSSFFSSGEVTLTIRTYDSGWETGLGSEPVKRMRFALCISICFVVMIKTTLGGFFPYPIRVTGHRLAETSHGCKN